MATETMTLVQRRHKERLDKGEEELKELEGAATEEEEEEQEEEDQISEPPVNNEEDASWKKRYGDLRRHSSQEMAKLKKRIEELESQPKQQKLEMPASDEDLEEWKQKYPQVAAIVETIALSRAEEIADRKFQQAKMDLDTIRKTQEETTREKALTQIKKKHEDFEEIQDSDEFWDWVDEQPSWVNDALNGDANSVIRVIDFYKQENGLTKKDQKNREKDSARLVKTKQKADVADTDKPKFSESSVQRMSAKEYAEKEEEIFKAMRSGEFIYDISGGAR